MPTRIILARHGETDWNRERRWQGHSDRPLNDTGREQAEALAAQLADEPIAAVYSSDLMRAYETARIVSERLGLDVVTVPGLRERRFGSWEGLQDVDVERLFPGINGPPDGESRAEMLDRVLDSLESIAQANPDRTVLVVSHGGPIRAVLRHRNDARCDGPVANCSVVDLEVD
jgi:2,3-bisphosphoglycerate-dependent phosphoglycerate mutase